MTTIVNIDEILDASGEAAPGVSRTLVARDGTTMEASLLRVLPGATLPITVPDKSDAYWFVIAGTGTMAENGGAALPAKPQVFAIAKQGSRVDIANTGSAPMKLLQLVSPPPGSGVELKGYEGPLKLVPAETVALAHEPENKKKRAYFVGPRAIPSGRAEGMIVHYEPLTVTRPHFHPDADSIFVILEGALEFTKGREVMTIRPGQAVFINQGHRHGTTVTPGHDGAAFLEFHVPATFQTIQDW